MGLGLSTPGTTGLNGDTMTDEEFIIHIGGMINEARIQLDESVQEIMNQIAARLNENSRTISYDDIARLEKRISDLENR